MPRAKKKPFHLSKYAHEHPLTKFLIVLLLFSVYMAITIVSFGLENGIIIAILTWTFFVFCTPIADAGLLLDFPIRMLTGIKMIHSELFVWILAFFANLYAFTTNPAIYQSTIVLSIFHHIIVNPFPFWSIILLSAIGTFMSVYFGDELLDVLSDKKKRRSAHQKHRLTHQLILYLFLILLVIAIYAFLLSRFDLPIPLL